MFALNAKGIVATKLKNKTKCRICTKTIFRVKKITPELVVLTCETCGDPQYDRCKLRHKCHAPYFLGFGI